MRNRCIYFACRHPLLLIFLLFISPHVGWPDTDGESAPPDMIPPPPPNINPPPPPPSISQDRLPKPPGTLSDSTDENKGPEGLKAPDYLELVQMEKFLQMPPEKLGKMHELIEKIEAMTAEQKEALLGRIRDIKSMSRERRQKFFNQFKGLEEDEKRQLVRIYYRTNPEEREEIRDTLNSMENPEERREYLEKLKEKFPHPYRGKTPVNPEKERPVRMQIPHRAPGEGN